MRRIKDLNKANGQYQALRHDQNEATVGQSGGDDQTVALVSNPVRLPEGALSFLRAHLAQGPSQKALGNWYAGLKVPGEQVIERGDVTPALLQEVGQEAAEILGIQLGFEFDASHIEFGTARGSEAMHNDVEQVARAAGIDSTDWYSFLFGGSMLSRAQREGVKATSSYGNLEAGSITIVPANLPPKLTRDHLRRTLFAQMASLVLLEAHPEFNNAMHAARRTAVTAAKDGGKQDPQVQDAVDTYAALGGYLGSVVMKLVEDSAAKGVFPTAKKRYLSRTAMLKGLLSLLPAGMLDYDFLGQSLVASSAKLLVGSNLPEAVSIMNHPSVVQLMLKTRGSVELPIEELSYAEQQEIVFAALEVLALNPCGESLELEVPQTFSRDVLAAVALAHARGELAVDDLKEGLAS